MSDIDLSAEDCQAIDGLFELIQEADHYEILNIQEDADSRQIQQAYYELSRRWHPDRFFRKELGEYTDRLEAVFVAVTEAYRTLSDEGRRFNYDHELKNDAKRAAREKRRKQRRPRKSGADAGPRKPAPSHAKLRRAAAAKSANPATSEAEAVVYEVELNRPKSAAATPGPKDEPADKVESPKAETKRRVRSRGVSRAIDNMRREVQKRLKRARRHYNQGREDLDSGRVVKAVSSLYLATTYDPQNEEYQALFAEAQKQARVTQARQYVQAAENAESFQSVREALSNYRKAVEYDPPDGRPYYRLALLVLRYEDDRREALGFLRTAVTKDPHNAEYRISLGTLYSELGMGLNARREFQAVLGFDKGNAAAKEALKKLR